MQVGIYELPKGYLSASSMDTLLKCPRMFEFRYIENRRKPSNKMLALGSITHGAFETYYRDVMDNTDDDRLTGRQMVEMTMDHVMPDWFDNNETDITERDREEIEEVVPDVVENYVDRVGCSITPVGVEKEVDFVMENQVPVKAYLDLVRETPNGQGLVDYKVSGKAWQLARLQNSLQFMLYSYITGIQDVQIQNIIKPASGKKIVIDDKYEVKDAESHGTYEFRAGSGLNILGHRFADSQKHYLEELVERCAQLITTGVFTLTAPGNWWCSPVYCDYWAFCRGKRV